MHSATATAAAATALPIIITSSATKEIIIKNLSSYSRKLDALTNHVQQQKQLLLQAPIQVTKTTTTTTIVLVVGREQVGSYWQWQCAHISSPPSMHLEMCTPAMYTIHTHLLCG